MPLEVYDTERLLKIATHLTQQKGQVIARLNTLANHLISVKDNDGLDQVKILLVILSK